jgi:DNA-damage-inducible protein J
MPNINVNIRMDSDLKRQFESVCADMGLTMTSAFTIFAKRVTRDCCIPFDVSCENPNAETREALQEVRRMKADPSLGKSYTDVDEMMEELLG